MGADISQFKQAELMKQFPAEFAKFEEQQNSNGVPKSRTYSHFSDFSMFPDRFNENQKSLTAAKPILITGGLHDDPHEIIHNEQGLSPNSNSHFSDYSLYPDKFNRVKRLEQEGMSLPSPSKLITKPGGKYNFRLRRSSESDQDMLDLDQTSSNQSPSPQFFPQAQQKTQRAKSLSNSKLYYFDFSLIPDKDPNCAQDQCHKNRQQFLKVPNFASHHALILEENMAEDDKHGQSAPTSSGQFESIQEAMKKAKRSRKNSEPRFGFFDYSMIPDKDPRLFASRKNSIPDVPDENEPIDK